VKTDRLRELIHIVEEADIDVLHIEENGFKLYYEKNSVQPIVHRDNDSFVKEAVHEEQQPFEEVSAHTEKEDQLEEIVSPMIGTFYARPEPGVDPYVQVGSTVTEGDTVCVLEAMKLMNEITSTVTGEIVDMLVSDGDVIEYGQPLFTVRVGE